MGSNYPEELAVLDYYEEIIGSEIIEPRELNDITEARYYIGLNKPHIDHVDETVEDEREGEM